MPAQRFIAVAAHATVSVTRPLRESEAFVVFSVLIREVGPGRATVNTFVNPVVAVGLGIVLLDEGIGAIAVAGLLLILAGSWLSTDGRLPPGLMRLVSRRRSAGRSPLAHEG